MTNVEDQTRTIYEPLSRAVVRDIAASMDAQEARWLVDYYYSVQDYRIQAAGQARAVSQSADEAPSLLAVELSEKMKETETLIKYGLQKYAEASVPGQWAMSITGIGPVIAAGLLAHIDITKAPTVGAIWKFAGLDPSVEWHGSKDVREIVQRARDAEATEWDAFVWLCRSFNLRPGEVLKNAKLVDKTIPVKDAMRIAKKLGGDVAAAEIVQFEGDNVLLRAFTQNGGQAFEAGYPGVKLDWQKIMPTLSKRPWNAKLKVLCCLPGQLVTTRRGYIPIEDVVVGDEVLTHEGRWAPVTDTHVRDHAGPVVGITRASGANQTLWVTEEHPVLARRRETMYWTDNTRGTIRWRAVSPPGDEEWVAAEEIEAADLVHVPVIPVGNTEPVWEVPAEGGMLNEGMLYATGRWEGVAAPHAVAIRPFITVTPLVAETVGLYLAEGHVTGNHIGFSFHEDEQEFDDLVRSGMKEAFGLTAGPTIFNRANRARQIIFTSKLVASLFREQLGKGSYDAQLPEWAFASRETATALLSGIVKGDGTPTSFGHVVTTVSPQLALGVADLARATSGWASVGEYWGVHKVSIGQEARPWVAARLPHTRWYEGPVHNLEIETDASYVIHGMAVHNCWKIGDSFVKNKGRTSDIYGHVYEERKEQEVSRNEAGVFADQAASSLKKRNIKDKELKATYEAGKLPPGRLDLRARRYAVKLFLAHLHHVMYESHYGKLPPKPYIIEHGGHVHYISPPNWPSR